MTRREVNTEEMRLLADSIEEVELGCVESLVLRSVADEIDALRERVDELEADKTRLDWVIRHCVSIEMFHDAGSGIATYELSNDNSLWDGENLRDLIDAAMQEEKP